MSKTENPRDVARDALKQAQSAARKGDLTRADRWSKTAERMAAAAEKLASLPPPADSYEDEEALRKELWSRLQRFADVNLCTEEWEAEYVAWKEAVARAEREGTPPPPRIRPHPHGPLVDVTRFPEFADQARAPPE